MYQRRLNHLAAVDTDVVRTVSGALQLKLQLVQDRGPFYAGPAKPGDVRQADAQTVLFVCRYAQQLDFCLQRLVRGRFQVDIPQVQGICRGRHQ